MKMAGYRNRMVHFYFGADIVNGVYPELSKILRFAQDDKGVKGSQ
jgi:hypothetical protein